MLAFTREVSPAIVNCELTHLARSPIDLATARREHDAYEAALRAAWCEVVRLPADAEMADAVFIEDTAVVLDELAIITRPGAASRRGEVDVVREALSRVRPLAGITAPGTLDGGDVLRIGRRLLVGVSPRSNEEGRRQLAAIVAPHGYTVEPVEFRGCLHLKTAATLVGDGVVLHNPAWVDAGALGTARVVEVHPAESFAGNALLVNDVVIYPAEFRATGERLRRAGLRLMTVAAGELAKAEGGVTCGCLLVAGAAD
ncbi:MAG: dimethylarginine dimethylaminohydrolase family protein [Gemmatimonadaceae bacterium]